MTTLTLSSGELCVLLSALDVDPRPFIDGSDLMALERPELTRRLMACRESLLIRKLAEARPDNSLAVEATTHGLLLQVVQPQTAFELLHARSGSPPQRIKFNFAAVSIIVHRFVGGTSHEFEQTMELAAIGRIVMAEAAPPDYATPVEARSVAMPHSTFAALARMPPEPNPQLLALLQNAGLAPELAAGILKAGTNPAQQTVFTSMALRGNKLQSRAIMWFADSQSCWLISNFNHEGNVVLLPANAANISQAVDSMVAAAL